MADDGRQSLLSDSAEPAAGCTALLKAYCWTGPFQGATFDWVYRESLLKAYCWAGPFQGATFDWVHRALSLSMPYVGL